MWVAANPLSFFPISKTNSLEQKQERMLLMDDNNSAMYHVLSSFCFRHQHFNYGSSFSSSGGGSIAVSASRQDYSPDGQVTHFSLTSSIQSRLLNRFIGSGDPFYYVWGMAKNAKMQISRVRCGGGGRRQNQFWPELHRTKERAAATLYTNEMAKQDRNAIRSISASKGF